LRARPALMFWLAALAQAALWVAVPMLFYAAPPSELAQLLAISRDFPLNGSFGPPLAYWFAEIAFRIAGLFGVYVLAQICVVATYWCVFTLGRAIVGATHALIAVLLMVGIFVFVVPTPNFGPTILAMPLWAATLLFYWRAAGERRAHYWYAAAGTAALLLITTDAALILLAALLLFAAATERGRASIDSFEGLTAGAVLVAVLCVHFLLLARSGVTLVPVLERLRTAGAGSANTAAWLQLLAALALAHAGLVLLVVLASGWPRERSSLAPVIARPPVAPFAASFVYTLAIVPALIATIVAVLAGGRFSISGAAPALLLSGLAAVVAAGERVELHHQRVLGLAWAGLLAAPVLFVPIVIVSLPWATATELKVSQPAGAMGRFFSENFARRTGRPLAVVGGDPRLAELVALGAPSRPGVYFTVPAEPAARINAQAVREDGAVIVWPAADTDPTPPADIKARFPDLVPEVPHNFPRPVRGRLPPLLIGWGVIRPANAPAGR